jgi:hypothetical protein
MTINLKSNFPYQFSMEIESYTSEGKIKYASTASSTYFIPLP